MRVRTIEMRILGAVIAALWFVAFALVLVTYRPGGPVDLWVGAAMAGPILIAIVAVLWPPVARGDQAFAAIAWLGLAAVLLLIPSLGGLIAQLTGLGPQTLLPSLEAAYPWLLALVATGVFAGLGVARKRLGEQARRRHRFAAGTALGVLMVLGAGSLFTSLAIMNELALGDRPASASRFGPTDPTLEPPPCNGALSAGSTARIDLRMDAEIDGQRTGQVVVSGIRDGSDLRWTGFAATRLLVGQVGAARIGSDTWLRAPRTGWSRTPPANLVNRDLDRPLVSEALTPANRAVAEDRGLSFIEGARARHCRVTIDGTTLRQALPEVVLLIGETDISRWRVDLEYWVFADGQLGMADGRASGPAESLADDALIATLRFRVTAIDRGLPISVFPPGT